MVRVSHPVLGIHVSCVWIPFFMDWWLFSNTGNHPMFWPRIQTIRDQTPDPFERVPHSCPDLGVATLRCESWAKLIFPNFPQLDMREPTVFLAPWGHRELPLTQLTSVIASERMKITNAHSQRRNHSQRSMWPKYIYNFYIDLHRFTMIYQPDLPTRFTRFTNPPASQLSRWDKLEESPKVQQSHELGIKLQDYSSKLQVLWRPTSQPQFYVTKTPTYTFTAFTSHQPSHNTSEIIGIHPRGLIA